MNDDNRIRLNGMTAEEWKQSIAPATDEQLKGLGFLGDDVEEPVENTNDTQQTEPTQSLDTPTQQQEEQPNKLKQTADALGIERPADDKEYQKLSLGESWKDAAISLGVEASHVFVPKSKELHYESKTHFGEAMKYGYRYIAGTASLFVGGGLIGGSIKAFGAARNLPKLAKLGRGIQKLFSGADIIKTGANATKGAKVGATIVNGALGGSLSGAIADYNLYRPEDYEGHMADAFGDNKYLEWLQTDENDTEADAKFKNVLEGFIVGMPLGAALEYPTKKLFGAILKDTKAAVHAQTAEEAKVALTNVALDNVKLEKFTNTADLVTTVKTLKTEADTTGQEASQLILDNLDINQTEEAQAILKTLEDGNDIFVHEDGTWDIKVDTWEDAYKVSPEEYKRQLAATDETNAGMASELTPVREGSEALKQQDEAVKDTWTNRGWLGENESLAYTDKNKKAATLANKVVKKYKDKFQIDNNIKVEYVDGLTVNGKQVDGNTQTTTYVGKTTKTKQNAIDKKQLQIEKIQDKINKLENSEYKPDVESQLREELRIAENELKELQKEAKNQNRIPDITIQVDKNAPNVYATLRAELEHARDIAKGTVPDQSQQHFSRYSGMNEAEAAPEYTYKKSVGKARALGKLSEDINTPEVPQKPVNELPVKPVEDAKAPATETTEQLKLDVGKETPVTDSLIAEKQKELNSLPKNYGDKEYIEELKQEINLLTKIKEGKLTKEDYLKANELINELDSADVDVSELREASNFEIEPYKTYIDRNKNDIKLNVDEWINKQKQPTQEAEQLKLDFDKKVEEINTPEDLTTAAAKGDLEQANTVEKVDKIVNKVIETDEEISSFKWQDVAEGAEEKYQTIMEEMAKSDISSFKEAFIRGDITTLNTLIKKQLAATKCLSVIADKIAALDDLDVDVLNNLYDAFTYIQKYVKDLGSAAGGLLQNQKLTNRAMETFGSSRLSTLTKEGISTFTDLLDKTIKETFNLNFTKGEVLNAQAIKAQIYQAVYRFDDGSFMITLSRNKELAASFDKLIDDIIQKGGQINTPDLYKSLVRMVTEDSAKKLASAVKLAPTDAGKIATIKNWSAQQGGIASYFINNLLSGIATPIKNIASGLMNATYFPARKILAGYMGGGADMVDEGWRTYQNLWSSMQESWSLARQAFLTGEGKLTNIGVDLANMDDGTFRGFRDLDSTNPIDMVQNVHSIMSRIMGASDEWMSQLNYRAICRAKCLNEVDKLAINANKVNDTAWKDTVFKQLFDSKFDVQGKPTDVDAYNEAKTMLYQNNLDGTMFDVASGEKVQMRKQTAVMRIAQNINNMANKNALIKFIFPFVKTGANILQMNLDHNIVYVGFSPEARKLFMSKTPEGAMVRSQVTFGFMSMGMCALLALNGNITGSAPTDPKVRKALFELGWRPYSFKVGNKYISYQGYEPLHTMLGFAADSVTTLSMIATNKDEDKWTQVFQQCAATVINNFVDKAAFRTGLNQLSLLTDPEKIVDWQKAMAQQAQGLLPASSFVRNISTVGKRSVTQPQTFGERFWNMYGNRGLGDYRRNVFGERQDIYNAIVTTAGDRNDAIEDIELARLAQLGYNPTEVGKVVSHTKIKFQEFESKTTNRSLYDSMQEELSTTTLRGKTLREAVADLIESNEYNKLPDGVGDNFNWQGRDTKVSALNEVFKEYCDVAKEKVVAEFGDVYTSKKTGMTLNEAVEANFVAQQEKINQARLGDDTLDKTKSLFNY